MVAKKVVQAEGAGAAVKEAISKIKKKDAVRILPSSPFIL